MTGVNAGPGPASCVLWHQHFRDQDDILHFTHFLLARALWWMEADGWPVHQCQFGRQSFSRVYRLDSNNIFAIVQITVSDLLKDSNRLGLECKSPGSSSSLIEIPPALGLEPLSPGMGTWNAASRPAWPYVFWKLQILHSRRKNESLYSCQYSSLCSNDCG